jgi:hypothetical protein
MKSKGHKKNKLPVSFAPRRFFPIAFLFLMKGCDLTEQTTSGRGVGEWPAKARHKKPKTDRESFLEMRKEHGKIMILSFIEMITGVLKKQVAETKANPRSTARSFTPKFVGRNRKCRVWRPKSKRLVKPHPNRDQNKWTWGA